MVMISNSEQNFGQWARRLITMEKVREWNPAVGIEAVPLDSKEAGDDKRPGHYLFREKVIYIHLSISITWRLMCILHFLVL